MKIAILSILVLTAFSIHAGYAKTREFKADIAAQKQITLLEAFRNMAGEVRAKFTPSPKARPIKEVSVNKDYDVRQYSIISSGRLDMFLGGVLKGKGDKFIEVARENNICPIFFAAICMHESANGNSKFSREKNNVFGIFKNGKYHTFDNVDDCIEFTGKLLGKSKLYAGGRNYSVVGIQRVYCPVGADNDPKGLNKYWLNGVLDKMKKIWGEKVFVLAAK